MQGDKALHIASQSGMADILNVFSFLSFVS